MNYSDLFANKRITVMGLGLLGRGVGDVEFLAKCGAQVIVTDKKTESELAESIEKLKEYSNVTFHLGAHSEKDFTDTDMIFKAAGVPLDSPYIKAARAAGVPVYMSTALFAKYAMEVGAIVVGITGTRGKSTVTQMIFETLKSTCEKQFLTNVRETVSHKRNVLLGGNIRGVSTLSLLPEVTKETLVVLELDSWQLQGFGDLKLSPQIAVFTNLMSDHQNYYPDMDAYFADKANIFRYQHDGDTLIIGKSIEDQVREVKPPVEVFIPPMIPAEWQLRIPGEHNRENASLAAEALRALKLSEDDIRSGLESFDGVTGRLQFVRELNGLKIYNDNNSTTPDATIAALKALDTGKKNVVLIMGGADKGLDTSNLLYEVAKSTKRVILLTGSGTEKVTPFMQDYSIYDSLHDAVTEALKIAIDGDIVLFSPAFASFGMFKNEYDRNDQFMSLVKEISNI
jgi:UDP-N-acetylmuramoylalanine--D-glutamate ligase